jgi:hypothetical protein
MMTIPQHPFRSQWQPIEIDVVGYRLVNTIETAALEAIHLFCNQHPMEVAGHPIGLFPAIDSSDHEWNFRIAHLVTCWAIQPKKHSVALSGL